MRTISMPMKQESLQRLFGGAFEQESLQRLFGGAFEHMITVNGYAAHYRQKLDGKVYQWKITRTTTKTIIAKMDFWGGWEPVITITKEG